MCGSQKKQQKTSILGQKDKFWTVFSQNGENNQKALGTFFLTF